MCFKTKGLYKCGKCPECLQERRLSWSLRLIQESRERSCFSALLTYRPNDVPMTEDGMSLSKKDVQLFLKRLRHHFDGKISYYIAGEYSPSAFRPHYHCLFFGFPENLSQMEIQKILAQTWRLGFIGSHSNWLRSSAQINYATNYIINLYDWPKGDKRVKPFNLISKGLALDYHPDTCNKMVRDGDPYSYGWHFDKITRSWVFLNPLDYDLETHELIVTDSKLENLDCIKVQQTSYNFKNNVTTLTKVQSFKMPRVWRERNLTQYERDFLNVIHAVKNQKKEELYLKMYGEYDKLNPDFPMWQQLKLYKWKQRKKSKKDKLLSDPEHYLE